MKRLWKSIAFFAIANMIVLIAPANAQSLQMPPEYRGVWCDRDPYLIQLSKWPRGEKCMQAFSLTATALTGREGPDCKLTKIKFVFIDKINLPEGIFTCPDGLELRFVFTTGSGSMGHKSRRLYLESIGDAAQK
jgi:hypothetical protein